MDEVTTQFVDAMVPILEQESGMSWGPKGVGRIVRWTCRASDCRVVGEAVLAELKTLAANYATMLRALNGLLEEGQGADGLEIADLAVKADGVSFPLQHLLDALWPEGEAGDEDDASTEL